MASADVYSYGRDLSVREEDGHYGVRQAIADEGNIPVNSPTSFNSKVEFVPGGGIGRESGAALAQMADRYQQSTTSRQFAPSASYPGQARPSEPFRDEQPKNHQEFELVGRNVGPHNTSNAVGGYVGVRQDLELLDNLTQRTLNDMTYTYYNPTGPFRFEKGNNAAYNQFFQHRMEHRGEEFKNAPGRFPGAFRHEIKRPSHPNELLWRSAGYDPRQTMKSDWAMVHRYRAEENPNREGLRVQYSDNYNQGWESLENNRRMQHTVEQTIDPTLIRAYSSNPYSVPLGIVPHRS
jgi:hypothetical protein